MSGGKKINVIVFKEYRLESGFEYITEVLSVLDIVHGSEHVNLYEIRKHSVVNLKFESDEIIIICAPELAYEMDLVIEEFSKMNACLILYEGNNNRDVRKMIRWGVKGIISTKSINQLPNALSEVRRRGYFLCQEILKILLGKVFRPNFEKILSRRELEVLNLLSRGETYLEISNKLCISYDTTKTHIYNIYKKLGARNKSEAVHKARIWMILT